MNSLNVQYRSKFSGKLSTLDGQTIRLHGKFEFDKCTISLKVNGQQRTLDVQKVWIRGKIQIRWIYDIMKIQLKIVYIRWTESLDS